MGQFPAEGLVLSCGETEFLHAPHGFAPNPGLGGVGKTSFSTHHLSKTNAMDQAFAWYQIFRRLGKRNLKVAKPLVSATHGTKALSLLKKNPPHRGEEEKEGRRKTRLKLGIYSKRSQQNVAHGQLHNREERRRSEGLLGTIKFLWWQPLLGRQGTEVAFRVLRTKRWRL